jgi:hypothetical protein
MNYPVIFSLPLILSIQFVFAEAGPCAHIFDEVQRAEQLSAQDIEPLRSGCEADLKQMQGYWQCMDLNMAQYGYLLENMLTLGDVCNNAASLQTSELATH